MTPTHRTSQNGDKIVIYGLHLFVGFDPEIDDEDDTKVRSYDKEKVAQVVARTRAMMDKGQYPKLILGHNPDHDDGSVRPAIGDIITIGVDPENELMILGDVEMSLANFSAHMGSNDYPRRSAEIWSDGYMSEVALLGSQTPARPLPDTKFVRDGLTLEVFSRELPPIHFESGGATISGDPGPTNTSIPRSDDMVDVKSDELTQLKAKCKMMEDEAEAMKAKLKAMEDDDGHDYDHDDDDKDKHARTKKPRGSVRALEMERDNFARELETQKRQTADMRADLLDERYSRVLDQMSMNGYRLGDTTKRAALQREIVSAADDDMTMSEAKAACDEKLNFMKGWIGKDPIGMRIDQTNVRLPSDDGGSGLEKFEREAQAADLARDRCTAEGITDGAVFVRYLEEEKKKMTG